jgi:hypothetical protein
MAPTDAKTIHLPSELSTVYPGFAPRVAWLGTRFGGVPLPLDPRDFVVCIGAIRAKFEFRVSKSEANNLVEFGTKLLRASIGELNMWREVRAPSCPAGQSWGFSCARNEEYKLTHTDQAPANGESGIHPSVPVPLELLLYTKITDFPAVIHAQATHGGIPVPVEAAHFEACSNLVASVLRYAGKPTKTTASQFWTDVVDATEYPRLAGIVVPPPPAEAKTRRLSDASARTAVSIEV